MSGDTPRRSRLRCAVAQLAPEHDPARALEAALAAIDEAAAAGAELVLLPEKWSVIGSPAQLLAGAEDAEGGPAISAIREAARRHGMWIAAGSMAVRVPGEERLRNAARMVSPTGEVVASYDKLHMFDVEVDGAEYRESAVEQPGDDAVVADVDGIGVGMTICYDVRFPELYRLLTVRGARVLLVPAAFTEATGRAHWEVLLRARAIENQCAVLAAGMLGEVEPGKPTWGHSMIVDAWGVVVAEVADGDRVAVADIDLAAIDEVRRAMPVLEHRRPWVYGLGTGQE